MTSKRLKTGRAASQQLNDAPGARRDDDASLSELLSDLQELHRQSQEKFDQIETLLSSLQPAVENARDLHLLRPADLAEAEGISERQVARILAKHPRLKRTDQFGRVVIDIAEFQYVR